VEDKEKKEDRGKEGRGKSVKGGGKEKEG